LNIAIRLGRTATVGKLMGGCVLALGALLLLQSCTPTPPPTAAAVQSTLVAKPEADPTSIPTATLPVIDTDEPEPTDTATMAPTATPLPTATPTLRPAAASTSAAVSTPAPADARDALVKAFERLQTAFPYRLAENTTVGGAFDRVTDFASADRWHTTWSPPLGPGVTEAIGIGKQTYWLVKGKWEAGSEPPLGAGSQVDVAALLLPGLKDVQFTGIETVGGTPCFAFAFNLQATGTLPVAGAGKAWVGISDGVPHRATLDGTASGYPLKSNLVYSYGVKFDIRPPL